MPWLCLSPFHSFWEAVPTASSHPHKILQRAATALQLLTEICEQSSTDMSLHGADTLYLSIVSSLFP